MIGLRAVTEKNSTGKIVRASHSKRSSFNIARNSTRYSIGYEELPKGKP